MDVNVFREVAQRRADSPVTMEAQVQEALAEDPMIEEYEGQIIMLQQEEARLRSVSRNPNSRDVRMIVGQIQTTAGLLKSYKDNAANKLRNQLRLMPDENMMAVNAEHEVRSQELRSEIARLEQQVDDNNMRIQELGTRNPKLDMMLDEITSEQEVEAELSQKLSGWKIDSEAVNTQITRYQQAIAIEQINTIERFSIAGVGGLVGLTLTAYGIALLEFGRRKLNGPENLDDGLGIRVLGVMPATTARRSLNSASLSGAYVSEAVDNVRAAVMHGRQGHRLLLVTSPVAMEGSTTVAVNLARSFARAGRRTLLIDGDVRSPSIHKLLGLPQENGLCEVLRTEVDPADAVQPTQEEGLYFMPAGHCDADAIQLLATDQPQPIFEKLRSQFDYVVVDSAPALGLADSVCLGQHVDGAILAVLRDQSGLRETHKAVETLRGMGVEVIGSVVNGVPLKADRRVSRLVKDARKKQPKLTAKAAKAEAKAAKAAAKAKNKKQPTADEQPSEEPTIEIDIEEDTISLDDDLT